MKIYTRTGDDGTTGLFAGGRVPKTHRRVEAYGAVDELNSILGIARASGPQPAVTVLLELVQRQLFQLGADLASAEDAPGILRLGVEEITRLEAEIDRMTAQLPPLRNFILPGGTLAASQIHLARTVCRRCEREVLRMEEGRQDTAIYLNRLSDFLFTLARFENRLSGMSETEWRP